MIIEILLAFSDASKDARWKGNNGAVLQAGEGFLFYGQGSILFGVPRREPW